MACPSKGYVQGCRLTLGDADCLPHLEFLMHGCTVCFAHLFSGLLLAGAIPKELGTLSKLVELYLSFNQISGKKGCTNTLLWKLLHRFDGTPVARQAAASIVHHSTFRCTIPSLTFDGIIVQVPFLRSLER